MYVSSLFIPLLQLSAGGNQSPLSKEKENANLVQKKGDTVDALQQESESPQENGKLRSNGMESEAKSNRSADRQPDLVDDHPSKSRFLYLSFTAKVII